MRSNRDHYLYQKLSKKLDHKLNVKSFLLIFISIMFLSACGIKGNLYQTPAQVVNPKDKAPSQVEQGQQKNIDTSEATQEKAIETLAPSQYQRAVSQPTELTTQATSQSTAQVNE